MRHLVLATFAAALAGTAAQAQAGPSIEQRLDRLEAENRYLRDTIDIWKLQSLYVQHMLRGASTEIVKLFADSPDVEIELSNKGVLRGADAPRRYFQPNGPPPGGINPRPPGSLVFHTAVNPVIEFSPDGREARAVWFSPGITNQRVDNKPVAAWNFGKYEMTYLKQNGVWKILHFRWRQMFLSPYDQGWVKAHVDPSYNAFQAKPDRPSAPDFYAPYQPDKVNKFDPPPPAPYPR